MAVDMFLKLDGIKGESKDSKHTGEIDILSFAWGVTQTGAHATGAGAGKANPSEFQIVKLLDSATPQIGEMICTGERAPSAVLTLRKAGDKPLEYMTVKLTDLLITSYQTGGSGGTSLPVEQISFAFANVDITAFEQRADGSLGGQS